MDMEQNTALSGSEVASKPRFPKYRVVMILCAAVFVISAVGLTVSLASQSDNTENTKNNKPSGDAVTDVKKLQGSWAADDVTSYVFYDGKSGKLKTAVREYDFDYTLQNGTLHVDFAEQTGSASVSDADYTCYLDGDKLTLSDNETGRTYKLMRQK